MTEKMIRHGLFTYHAPEDIIDASGQEVTTLTEHIGMHREVVDITRKADLARGEKYGAFYTDEERAAIEAGHEPGAEPVEDVAEGSAALADLEDDDLVDWLMSTGRFDGNPKPKATEVVAAAGEDAELAGRLLDAEDIASGNDPRKSVTEPLEKLIAKLSE